LVGTVADPTLVLEQSFFFLISLIVLQASGLADTRNLTPET
jgi:hypothetical protein